MCQSIFCRFYNINLLVSDILSGDAINGEKSSSSIQQWHASSSESGVRKDGESEIQLNPYQGA